MHIFVNFLSHKAATYFFCYFPALPKVKPHVKYKKPPGKKFPNGSRKGAEYNFTKTGANSYFSGL
ncbi:MAG TPA: hypothetical protein DCP61_06825 [Treponema sp.]|nr:hypothetical protein [Treponema sp.]